jgi:hypothetical protein
MRKQSSSAVKVGQIQLKYSIEHNLAYPIVIAQWIPMSLLDLTASKPTFHLISVNIADNNNKI